MRLDRRMTGFAVVMALVANVVAVDPTTGISRTITFAPVADATIRADRPTRSYGTASTLTVDNSPIQHALLRFTVAGVATDAVTHASLRMYVTNPSPVAGSVYRVTSQTWTESVTWATAPAADTAPLVTLTNAVTGTWADFDVTPLITGDGTFSVRITSTSADGAAYTSREGTTAQRPQLVVTTAQTIDITNPTASITAPAAGATLTGTTSVTVNASDDVAVTAVDIAIDGIAIGSDTTAPYEIPWDTTAAANGTHAVTASARDAAGNVGVAAPVSVTVANIVDTQPPTAPTGLTATVNGPQRVTLAWVASTDDVAVTSYEVQRDAVMIGASTSTGFVDTTVAAGATVSYSVVALDAAGHRSDPSDSASATTPNVPSSFTFAASGDHGANVKALASLASLDASPADFYLALGDMDYDQTPTDQAWCDYVHTNLPTKGALYPFEVVTGNHESDTGPNGSIQNFAACLPDRLGATAGPGSIYGAEYAVDYPATTPLARIIMISPELTVAGVAYHYVPGNTHYNWLESQIDSARAAGIPWVIVGMHYPCLSAGQYPCAEGPPLMNLLVSKRVDLVLHGHDHNYQRGKQLALDPVTCPSIAGTGYTPACVVDDGLDGIYPKGAGTIDVISGTFGQSLYPVSSLDPEAPYFAKLDSTTNGYTQYTVSAGRIDARFVPTTGTATDAFSIVSGAQADADREPPSTPGVPIADTAVPGRVSLTWAPSTDNVALRNYAVLRDGLAVGTTTTAAFTDTTVASGATYSYTVIAYDTAGNPSAASLPATVTVPIAATLTFAPDADASIYSGSATNYGAAVKLEVDNSPIKNILIRFTVSGVGTGAVTAAKLRLTCVDPSSRGGDFTLTAATTWTESTVTWNTAPAAGAIFASLGAVVVGTTYEIDLSSVILGDGTYTLRITTPSSDGADYVSKEGAIASRPQLIVTTSP